MSQTNQILKHLKEIGPLTARGALKLYDCMRCAARIQDLRDDGYNIHTQIIEKDGKRFARYIMNNGDKQ